MRFLLVEPAWEACGRLTGRVTVRWLVQPRTPAASIGWRADTLPISASNASCRSFPELQRPLAVGDRIPDGPSDTAWYVVERVTACPGRCHDDRPPWRLGRPGAAARRRVGGARTTRG